MTGRLRNILTIAIALQSLAGYSQKGCTVPASPLLKSVSVEPETGYTEINWSVSPSSGIAAYIIYDHSLGYWNTIDTLWDSTATSFIYHSAGTKYFSESYVVAAFRKPVCASPLSNILSTIFCSATLDTCKKQIKINWSKYPGSPLSVLEYRILVSKDGSPLAETYSVDSLTYSYLINGFDIDSSYCFAVKAILGDGSESCSNKSCLVTKMQRPPGWINADYATVNNDKNIEISFTFDAQSEISSFNLERKTGSSGNYKTIAHLTSTSGNMSYTDDTASIDSVNYYMIAAINDCSLPVVSSNIASNIVLSLGMKNDSINLKWNPYRQWNGTIGGYKLLVNTGSGMEETANLTASDSVYNVNYSSLMYDITQKQVCFTVEALEVSNPYGISGKSFSSSVCTPIVERITVPNTFTPDNNLINDTFKPFLSFTPVSYRLIITDLRRRTLFDTSDYTKEWDGTAGGSPMPEGVYLWFLKVVTPSGKTISKSGTVNIIFNR
ncbi:MAG: gliding motility-associated C-terminal domain-containing protein [Bacteroidales bacterium]|jgi:gliding motility-associated-like protein